jgi:hypothetical protein
MVEDASAGRAKGFLQSAASELDPEILAIAASASAIAIAALTSALRAAETGGLVIGSHVIDVIAAARDEERTHYRYLHAPSNRKPTGILPSDDQVATSLETQSSLIQ